MRRAVCEGRVGLDDPIQFRNLLKFALYGVREKLTAEAELGEVMRRHPAFRDFPVQEAWRLCLDHDRWHEETTRCCARTRRPCAARSRTTASCAAFAETCRTLEQAHLFNDGNARTVGFLLLNRLLLNAGMSPALMANPNEFDGFSVGELVQSIRQGQEKFARTTGALQA